MPDDDRAPVLAFPQAPDAIELRHLRAFVAVAEELNFGRAADRLHLSQSALSRQVRGLEQLLGCDLLRRSTHSVELTIAGEALLDRARRLLTDVDEAVSVTLSIGGELAGRLTQLWAPLFAVANANGGLQAQRNAYEQFHAQFAPPPEVAITPVNAGGVPSFELTTDPDALPTLLYLHGGGHVMGSAFGHKPLMGALAVAAGARILAPEYRLAPEHPFPADLEDARRAISGCSRPGTPAEQVVVAGDSAGCGVVMSLLLSLKQQGVPLPGGALLFCPWVDLSGTVLSSLAAGDEQVAAAARADPQLRRRVPRRAPDRRSRRQPPDRRPHRPASDADPGRHRRPAARGGASPRRARPRPRGRRAARALPRRHPRVPDVLVVPARGDGRARASRAVRARDRAARGTDRRHAARAVRRYAGTVSAIFASSAASRSTSDPMPAQSPDCCAPAFSSCFASAASSPAPTMRPAPAIRWAWRRSCS